MTSGPTSRCARYRGDRRIEVFERPRPEPGPGEVLVDVAWCGVCGSDLHFVLDGWSPPDVVHGHEWSGTVAQTGAGVTTWSVGDRVVGYPSATGDGAFATHHLTDATRLVAVPPEVDLRAAALTEPLAVAMHALARADLRPGEEVLVSGAGPIGALAVALLVDQGHPVRVTEPRASRRELALALGATVASTPDNLEVPSIAEPTRIVEGAVDVVIECSGARSAIEAGLAQLRPHGRLVLVGAGIDPPRLDPNRILLNELVVTGAFEYEPDGFEAALALLATGRLPLDRLVHDTDVALDGIVGAMEALASGAIAGKVLVNPRADGSP